MCIIINPCNDRINFQDFCFKFSFVQSKKFFSVSGMESWTLTILCSGMAPCRGFLLNLLMIVTIAPLKFIGQIIQWNFKRIVRNHAESIECSTADGTERITKSEEQIKETDSGVRKRPNRQIIE